MSPRSEEFMEQATNTPAATAAPGPLPPPFVATGAFDQHLHSLAKQQAQEPASQSLFRYVCIRPRNVSGNALFLLGTLP